MILIYHIFHPNPLPNSAVQNVVQLPLQQKSEDILYGPDFMEQIKRRISVRSVDINGGRERNEREQN